MSENRPCETCGETDYYEQGGFYYCQECNTQSQGMRRIENANEHFDMSGNRTCIYTKVDKHIRELEKEELDFGIPWTTHDAFGILLKAQAEALVKLGAPAALPILVEKLWTRYQSRKSGTPLPRDRDTAKDLSKGLPPLASWRAFRKRKGRWPKKIEPSFLTPEERKDWKTQQGIEEEEEEEETPSPDVERDTNEFYGIATRTSYHQIKRMKMGYSLCFIYISLLHLESHVSLADVLRWGRECALPYLNPLHFFPDNLKFSGYDLKTFANVKCLPTPTQVRQDAGRLTLFLQLNPFPAVDIRRLVARYLIDLNLPDDLMKISSGIISALDVRSPVHAPRPGTAQSIPNYEAMGVAVLLMTLKLVFRLDGVTEFVLSHLVAELEKIEEFRKSRNIKRDSSDLWYIPPSTSAPPEMFSFSEWFQFASECLVRLKSRKFPTPEDLECGEEVGSDVAHLALHYSHNLVNKKGSVRRADLPSRLRIDALQSAIADLLLDGADVSDSTARSSVTSFPVLGALESPENDAAAEAEWRASAGAASNSEASGKKLFRRDLGFLIRPPLQQKLLKDDVVLRTLNLPHYEIDEETGKARCDWSACGIREPGKKLFSNRKTVKNLLSHQTKYCFLIEWGAENLGKSRTRAEEIKELTFNQSQTVKVLIDLCAEMLEEDPKTLTYDVGKLERRYPMDAVASRATSREAVRSPY